MKMDVVQLTAVCRARRIKIDLINLAVGTMMIDDTGIVGRGSAAVQIVGGNPPPIAADDSIIEAAQTFIVHPNEGKTLLLNREEFEDFLSHDSAR
jgi:hypothetical protein